MQVYFLRAGEDGPIKIGMCKDIKKRMHCIKTGHYELIMLLRVEECKDIDARRQERFYHVRFENDRIRGEWFKPHNILEYLRVADITWEQICIYEPELRRLYDEAKAFDWRKAHDEISKCAGRTWYRDFKPRLLHLVGFLRKLPPRELHSCEAYDIAYHKIADAMPHCGLCDQKD